MTGFEPAASCSQSRRATNCATPGYEVVGWPGRILPKQARYQLRYTRLWNCVICGLTCGLGRFLAIGFAELVPASDSAPAGCGVVLFSHGWATYASKAGALPTALHPVMKFSNYGQTCGLGRFLTSGFAEMVPSSGSVPTGFGGGLFPSRMRPARSQSRHAISCATPTE